MRGVLVGALLVVLVAAAGWVTIGKAAGPSVARVSAGPTGGDGPSIAIVKGTPTVGSSRRPGALRGAARVAKLFKRIPQRGLVLGRANAPVMLIEYVDLQCPICQEFEAADMRTLVRKFVRPGKLRIEIQPWNIIDRNVGSHDSLRGQEATIAAARQNKAFQFAEVLYDHQGTEGSHWLNDGMVSKIAASVDGLRPYKLAADANSAATRKVIKSIARWGNSHPTQMTGTPTLYLVRRRGRPKYFGTGIPPLAELEAAINALLK